MKRIFLICLCLFLFSCSQENLVTISGKFKNMDGVLVTLTFNDKSLKTDVVKDGRFKMQLKLPNNQLFSLSFLEPEQKETSKGNLVRDMALINLFTEDKEAEIFIEADSVEGLLPFGTHKVLSKGTNQIEYNKYLSLQKLDRDKNMLKHTYLSKKQDEALLAKNDSLYTVYSDSLSFQERINAIAHNNVTKNFIADYPNSYVSMYLLSKRSDLKNNLEFYRLLYNKADRKYRKSWYGLLFAKRVEKLEKLREKYIKKLAVDAFDLVNAKFDYRKYKNSKLIVFDFWANWCIPCMEDMPSAMALAKELGKRSVSYVFLSYDFNYKSWNQQSKKMGLTNNTYYLSDQTRKFLTEELQVTSIPRYMVLNNKGEILVIDAPSPSSPKLKELIESML